MSSAGVAVVVVVVAVDVVVVVVVVAAAAAAVAAAAVAAAAAAEHCHCHRGYSGRDAAPTEQYGIVLGQPVARIHIYTSEFPFPEKKKSGV